MEIKPQLLTGRPHLTGEGKCQTGIRLAEANRFVFAWKVVVLQKRFDCMAQNPQKVAVRNWVCFRIDHEKRTGLPKMSVRNAVYGNFSMVKVHASWSTARMSQRSVFSCLKAWMHTTHRYRFVHWNISKLSTASTQCYLVVTISDSQIVFLIYR